MSLVSAVCFGIAAVIVASCFKRGADPLSPARVFSLVWAVAIGLADLKLSRFQHEWSLYSWIVLLLGVIAFLGGVFTAFSLSTHRSLLSVSEIRNRLQAEAREQLRDGKLFWIIVVLFLCYALAYVAEVIIEGNVPIFSERIEKLRVEFGVFGLHLVVDAMLSILLLVVFYYLLMSKQVVRKLFLATIFVLTAGSFFLLLQRYTFFVWGIFTLGLTYYASRRLRLRNLLIAGALFVGLLVVIQSIRLSQYAEQYYYVISRMKYSSDYASFTGPYMYVVMNLENFARGVDRLDQFTYGYFSMDWLLALVGLKHWMGQYFHIVRLPFLVSWFNTFPFHWWYYYDFGVVGVALLPFLTGLAVGVVYYRLRSTPSIRLAFLYSLGLVLMVISYTMNPLNRLDFVSNVVLIWLVLFVVKKKKRDRPALQEGP